MNQVYMEKLIEKMKEAGLDAVLISPSAEMNFFLGDSPMQCERFQGLFVKADGDMFYVCNLLYGGYDVNGKQVVQTRTWKPDPDMSARQIKKELDRQCVMFEEECKKGQFVAELPLQSTRSKR